MVEQLRRLRLPICVENVVLIGICLADMFTTLYLVTHGLATEQNPLMAACIAISPLLFVLVKTGSFVPFVIAVELYRRRNPGFARKTCLCAIVLYVFTFCVLTLATNVT